MSIILRGRVCAYDNVAVGSATGRERTTGQTPSTELIGGGFGGSTDIAGATAMGYSNTTVGNVHNTTDPAENIVAVATVSTVEIV